MNNIRSIVISIAIIVATSPSYAQKKYCDYVNPFIGASTNVHLAGAFHGLGKTFPGATTPYGLVQVSPNTITGGDNGSGYSDEHKTIEGFAFLQMSGIGWYGDLGNFLVMPTIGELHTAAGTEANPESGYRSRYDKSSEKASAGYYTVLLSDYRIKAEMTALPHSGILRFTFPKSNKARIQIDLARRVGGTSVWQTVEMVNNRTIRGKMVCTPAGGGWGNGDGKPDYTVYFYGEFSRPIKTHGVWSAQIPDGWSRKRKDIESNRYQEVIRNAKVISEANSFEGKHIGFFADYKTYEGEKLTLKVGISLTSLKNAEKNFNAEIKNYGFDDAWNKSRSLWNDALSKIAISGGTEDEKTIFYTALYHTMIDPRIMSDVNGEYIGSDKQIHQTNSFKKRTIFSGWDVFRSQMPLQTIINPSLVNDLINSLTEMATQSGKDYLERWEFLNAFSGCMVGNPAISVLCDAWQKGIRNYDIDKVYKYAVNTSHLFGNNDAGYTPDDISRTLEYCYDDWCMSQLAQWLNKTDDVNYYGKRAGSWKTIFNSEHGWFLKRQVDGSFADWPAKGRLQDDYGTVESNPYQQGWFVPHDIPGMIEMMGGKEKTLADLTDMFDKTRPDFIWNSYYNHANEPVHHVPYLFNRLGAPWLTQKWTRTICKNAYHNSVLGLVGNEDVGQMSAWYVLSASGFHPICPGDGRYEITSPVFGSITFKLDRRYASADSFIVVAHNNSAENIYIQSAKLNGKDYQKCYLLHKDIITGGKLELEMGPQPSAWGKE